MLLTNEVRFRRLSQRVLLSLAPFSVLIAACGGSSSVEPGSTRSAGGHANDGVAGSAASSGALPNTAGSSGAGAGGSGGAIIINAAGAGSAAGNGAAAGVGGASGGASGGSGGDSGSAGMGIAGSAGSAGSSAVCHAPPPQFCAGGPITIPRSCVPEASASAGTALPLGTCRTMCESMFTTMCSVSTVQPTTLTVLCSTVCPAG